MRKAIFIFSLVAVISATAFHTAKAQSNVIDEVVWVVGDEAILKSQIEEQRLRMLYEGEKINGDPYCFIPEQMAIQKLFLHQAKLDSITATESQVLQETDARLNYYVSQIGSKEKLEEYFNKPYSQIREEMKSSVRDQNVIKEMQKKITGNIKVSPSDVRKYFSSISADSVPFIPTQVEVQLLVMNPKIPTEEIESVKGRLRDYTERVNTGKYEFSTLAVLYSEDKESAKRGGEIGFTGKGLLDAEFANAAFSLTDPKKVSRVVESEFGFHIIQLIEKRGDRINCRHILLKPQVSDEARKKTLLRLDSLLTELKANKFSFDEAALYASQDKDTRNNNGLMVNGETNTSFFEMQQLPAEVARAVESLKPGELSKPFVMINKKNKEVCAIVKLKSRVDGHKANVSADYQALKQMVEEKKRSDLIKSWLKKKMADTYIKIKDEYRNCDFEYKGWVK